MLFSRQVTDKEKQKQQEAIEPAELDSRVAEFEALLDAAVDAVCVIDHTGTMERVNKATETLFGYTREELIGQPVTLLMTGHDRDTHDQYMASYMRTGVRKIIGIGREVHGRRKDGTDFPIDLAVGEATSGDRVRFVGVMRDLTDQRAAEEEALHHRQQMNHVARLSTMGEMAAGISHELNQPLSAIATYCGASLRLLDQGPDKLDEVKTALTEISEQAHRAGEVIRRMRSFTRARDFEPQVVNIEAMLEEIWPLAELDGQSHHVHVSASLDPDLPEVRMDSVSIQQVLLNLLRNGTDAISDADSTNRQVELTITGSADGVCFEVRDTGPGIADDALKELFDPFYTTKAAGLGMGLPICRTIVAEHGGRLECENIPGSGARFWFTLPLREDSPK